MRRDPIEVREQGLRLVRRVTGGATFLAAGLAVALGVLFSQARAATNTEPAPEPSGPPSATGKPGVTSSRKPGTSSAGPKPPTEAPRPTASPTSVRSTSS